MTDPLAPLVEALKAAGGPQAATTRLATVTGGTETTISVRFDGETIASPRAYPKVYAPAAVGDRVVMMRAGSSWVAIARVPTSSTAPDTGWITPTLLNGWTEAAYGPVRYRRLNGIVYLRGILLSGTVTTPAFALPVGFRSANEMRVANWGGASPGNMCGVFIDSSRNVTPYWRSGGTEVSLDGITFPADN